MTDPTSLAALRERVKSPLRAVTLLQPWAQLVIERVKPRETRSTPFLRRAAGETIVLHSSQKFPPLKTISEDLHELCIDTFGCAYNYSLPLGRGLGLIKLGHTASTEAMQPLTEEDRIAGDWRSGRYATDIKEVDEWAKPVPAKGMLGLWKWPSALLAQAGDQRT